LQLRGEELWEKDDKACLLIVTSQGQQGVWGMYEAVLKRVLPDEPTVRGAATSWRVYRSRQDKQYLVLPLVGIIVSDQREDQCHLFWQNK